MFATAFLAVGLVIASQTQLQPEEVARLATEGWTAARAAAAKGGSPESLAPARRVLRALEKPVLGTALRLQREYAVSLIAAAMAAAQDERGRWSSIWCTRVMSPSAQAGLHNLPCRSR